MKSSKQNSRSVAFVLNGEALERLVEILSKYSTSLQFRVSLSGGTNVYPETVEELIKLPNPEHRQITQITIESDYKSQVRVEMSLGGDSKFQSVWLSLTAQEADVLFLDRQIEDWLATIRQWYSWLAFHSLGRVTAILMLLLIGLALLFPRYVIPYFLPGKQINFDLLRVVGMVLILGVVMVDWLVEKLLPRAIFSIGAGAARYAKLGDRRKQWRLWTVATTILLGLALAVLLKVLKL